MDYKYIEQLLNKYWECETSTEEELILRSFFSQDDIPENLSQFAPLFRQQADEHNEGLGTEFDERILGIIEAESGVADHKEKTNIFRLVARQVYPLIKAAAVVAVILAIGNVAEKVTMDQDSSGYTPDTEGTYIRQENISAQIKVIDQSRSESSIAKADSLNGTNPSTPTSHEKPIPTETMR